MVSINRIKSASDFWILPSQGLVGFEKEKTLGTSLQIFRQMVSINRIKSASDFWILPSQGLVGFEKEKTLGTSLQIFRQMVSINRISLHQISGFYCLMKAKTRDMKS